MIIKNKRRNLNEQKNYVPQYAALTTARRPYQREA
jgi:hypothetical protein